MSQKNETNVFVIALWIVAAVVGVSVGFAGMIYMLLVMPLWASAIALLIIIIAGTYGWLKIIKAL